MNDIGVPIQVLAYVQKKHRFVQQNKLIEPKLNLADQNAAKSACKLDSADLAVL